ncbi:MAG: tripartite tricarboxylate transporter substrate binding protein [Betaproteobacteria bacterium]|nr:tripartite tricarboxylate transporter substrate binding protein [Betaproteobacteria bacterium]
MRLRHIYSLGLAAGLATGLAAGYAHAQQYPARPLRMIVPYPPGGAVDFTARLLAQRLGESLGQAVVIDNRGGGGGVIAADLAARAQADGYTLFFGTPASLCVAPAIQSKVPYDTLRDFAPISRLVVNPQILVVLPSFPANNVAELIQVVRAKPGAFNYASVGVGSPQHLGIELLKARAKLDILHVPYKGGGPAMTDVLAGRVQIYMASIPGLLPHIKDGKIKVLGVAALERSQSLPNVPTIVESLPGYEYVGTWYGMLTQTKVAPAIITRLNGLLNKALQADDIRQTLISHGSLPQPSSVEDFARFLRSDCPSWARAVKLAGIKPE